MKQFNLVLTSPKSSSLKGFEATSQLPKVAPKFDFLVVLEIHSSRKCLSCSSPWHPIQGSIDATSEYFFANANQKKFIQLEFAKRLKIDAWLPILK